MTQTYSTPQLTDSLAAWLVAIAASLDTLRTLFSGPSAPPNPVPYQLWADTTNKVLKMYDGTATWVVVCPLLANGGLMHLAAPTAGASVSATTQFWFPVSTQKTELVSLTLVGSAATSSSSGNEWQFSLTNVTQGVECFSSTVGTHTALGGVGGGEMAADTAYTLVIDQNGTANAGDVMRLTVTEVGSATTFTMRGAQLDCYARGN